MSTISEAAAIFDKENSNNISSKKIKSKKIDSPRKSRTESPRRNALSILKGVFSPSKKNAKVKVTKNKEPEKTQENVHKSIRFEETIEEIFKKIEDIKEEIDKSTTPLKEQKSQPIEVPKKKDDMPNFGYVSTPHPFTSRSRFSYLGSRLDITNKLDNFSKKRNSSTFIETSSPKRRRVSYGKAQTKSINNDENFTRGLNRSLTKCLTTKIEYNESSIESIKPMSMAEMLAYIIFENESSENIRSFILSYQHFKWNPKDKFQTLWNLYRNPSLRYWKPNTTRTDQRAKVIRYLLQWMQHASSDFDFESYDSDYKVPFKYYKGFLELIKADEGAFEDLNLKLPSLSDKEFYPGVNKNRRKSFSRRGSINHRRLQSISRPKETTIDSLNFAIQLARYEFLMFKNVQLSELIDQRWNKEDKELVAPNLTKMIKHFNKFTEWIALDIASAETPKEQSKKIEKFILIGKKSKSIGNFNGVMEIISGLSSVSVQKLTHAWKLVSEKHIARLKKLESFMSPSQNFREYRQKIESTKSIIVPYIGVHLGDIVHVMEGYIDTCQGLYDLDKVLKVGNIISQWRDWQCQIVDIEEDQSFTQISNNWK